jgi:hypothetical protein
VPKASIAINAEYGHRLRAGIGAAGHHRSDKLPAAVAEKLKRLADDAQLFAGADVAPSATPSKLRDARETVIAVEADGEVRTIHADAVGSISNKSLREFVALVREQADRQRGRDKPG